MPETVKPFHLGYAFGWLATLCALSGVTVLAILARLLERALESRQTDPMPRIRSVDEDAIADDRR